MDSSVARNKQIYSCCSRSPSLLSRFTTKTTAFAVLLIYVYCLTVGLSHLTTTSVLTQGINITQKKLPHPPSKVEALETYIEVAEDGPILDYDEAWGGEQEAAMVNPAKGHQCVSSETHTRYSICYIIQDLSTGHCHPKASQTTSKIHSNRPPRWPFLCQTVIPTVIIYFLQSKNPWEWPSAPLGGS